MEKMYNPIVHKPIALDIYERRNKNRHKAINPIAPGQADLVQWQVYDRQTTAANTVTSSQYTFFNTPIGGTKTKADTNLTQVSRLEDPQWMNVQSIGFQFMPDMIKSDIDAMLKDYWFEFWVGQKIYMEGPLQSAPSGYGEWGATTQNNVGVFNNGAPAGLHLQFNLILPAGLAGADGLTGVTILQGQTFVVKVIAGTTFTTAVTTSPTNGTGVNFMCFLSGILSRGVQ